MQDYEKLAEDFLANTDIFDITKVPDTPDTIRPEAQTETEKYWTAVSQVLLNFVKSYMKVATNTYSKDNADTPLNVISNVTPPDVIGTVDSTKTLKKDDPTITFEGF